jgi:hypothetical protein
MKKAIFITALFWAFCSNCSAQLAHNNAIRLGEEFTFFSKWKGYPQYYNYKKMWNIEYIRNLTPVFYLKLNYYKMDAFLKTRYVPADMFYYNMDFERSYQHLGMNMGYSYWKSRNNKHSMNLELGGLYRRKIYYVVIDWFYGNNDKISDFIGTGYLSKQLGANLNLNYSFFPTRFLEWNVFVNGRFYTRDKALPVIQRENTISVGTNIGFRFGRKKK